MNRLNNDDSLIKIYVLFSTQDSGSYFQMSL